MPNIPLTFRRSEQPHRLSLPFSVLATICAFAFLVAGLVPGNLCAAEEKVEFPAASQHAVVKQRVGLTDVEVDYSRPNKNNREIFGGLVPFGKTWRTGANKPTRIKFGADVKLGDKPIPAGEYLLYTIPNVSEWTVIFSKDLNAQSVADYKQEADAARVVARPMALTMPVETFTIGFENLRANSATLYLDWDKTRVPLWLTTNDIEKVSKGIDAAIKSGKPQEPGFYYSAASFYFDQSKDLPQALKWVDQAIEKNPKAYYMFYKKAQILAKMGKKEEAIAAAEKSIEILQAGPNPDESAIGTSRALIDSLR